MGSRPSVDFYEDTRQAGLNYIIITRVDAIEAERIGAFLAGHRIDVMLLPDNNAWLVVTRGGFETWLTNPSAQRLSETLRRLGREWRTQHGGSRDFDDLYGQKFSG